MPSEPDASAEPALRVLLDQNVPLAIGAWLRALRPDFRVTHVNEVDLKGKSEAEIVTRARAERELIVTFDEDLADQRLFPLAIPASFDFASSRPRSKRPRPRSIRSSRAFP